MTSTTEIDKIVGAVRREVSFRDIEGKPGQVIIASRVYDTTIDDLWDALTNRERLPRWFAPVSGDLRLGGSYQIEGNASGEIQECDPPRRLALTWVFADNVSWVSVELVSIAEEQTELRLEHAAHTPEEFWNEYGPGAGGVGWDLAWLGLHHYLAGGPMPVTPEFAEAWATTDEGKEFVRRCSSKWGDAAIAAGTDATQARAAAKRTTEFYGG